MWLCCRLDLSRGLARQLVDIAATLETLPAIAAAFDAGRLSWEQLVIVCSFAISYGASWKTISSRRTPIDMSYCRFLVGRWLP